jgi:plastocyanin
VALGVPACSGGGDAKPDDCVPVTGGRVTIEGTISGWEPDCLSVAVGTDVQITADLLDEQPHDLEVSGPGLAEPVGTGDPVASEQLRLEVGFDEAGSYRYVCTIHASMEGSVYVEE